MNMKLFFPILLFSLIFESCKHVKDPEFRKVENLRLKSVGFQQVVIGFNVTYYNPNNFGVSVKEAEINVSIDSIYLGRFTQDEPVIVKSTTDFTIPFSGSIPYPTALKLNLQD